MNKIERGPVKKTLDKATYLLAFVTLPLAIVGGVGAFAAGKFLTAGIAGTSAFLDYIQIKEHDKPPEAQSIYNPERITDLLVNPWRFFNKSTSTRMMKTDNMSLFPSSAPSLAKAA